jgi:hypothetical protein
MSETKILGLRAQKHTTMLCFAGVEEGGQSACAWAAEVVTVRADNDPHRLSAGHMQGLEGDGVLFVWGQLQVLA